MNLLRKKINQTVFALEWTAIVEEKEREKKERMDQITSDKLLDHEALRAKRKEQREQKKAEKRKKKYLEICMVISNLDYKAKW